MQQFEQDNTPNDPTGAIETTSAADSAGAADTTNRTDPTVEANETMMAATNVTAVPLEGENSTTTSLKTQILRFIATGCVSAVVDFGLLLLLSYLGLNTTVSKGISFICGTALAYALNRRWTFQAEHSTKRLIAVCILYAVTFGLNVGIFHVVYKAHPVARTPVGKNYWFRGGAGCRHYCELYRPANRHLPSPLKQAASRRAV